MKVVFEGTMNFILADMEIFMRQAGGWSEERSVDSDSGSVAGAMLLAGNKDGDQVGANLPAKRTRTKKPAAGSGGVLGSVNTANEVGPIPSAPTPPPAADAVPANAQPAPDASPKEAATAALMLYSKEMGMGKARDLLQTFGAVRFSEIKEDDYERFIAAAKARA